jgi:hypothetical protein
MDGVHHQVLSGPIHGAVSLYTAIRGGLRCLAGPSQGRAVVLLRSPSRGWWLVENERERASCEACASALAHSREWRPLPLLKTARLCRSKRYARGPSGDQLSAREGGRSPILRSRSAFSSLCARSCNKDCSLCPNTRLQRAMRSRRSAGTGKERACAWKALAH